MTNNGAGKIGGFGTVIFDSGSDTPSGKKRIGISATEIELLDDIPPSTGAGLTQSGSSSTPRARGFDTQTSSSSIVKRNQQNNYETLSSNREQSKPNVVYQDENNQHLNHAVDQLLEKYAPDAIPQNVANSSNNRRAPPPQSSIITSYDQPPIATFQTTAPPPSSSTASNNYSTIIRPNTGQIPQTQTQTQNNNNVNIRNGQTTTHSRPTTNYDSFQHVIPPVQQQHQQQQQQQQQSQRTIPVKTKNGNFTHVVPGKLYTLDDDPLHLLYDRQMPPPTNQQQPSFTTTFQPSSQPSTVLYTNASQRYPQQQIPLTTNPNPNIGEPFDLGNLIKRVQQDYLREIQPFVSSVKFVEKDREYGQSLADVGFITPVTARKGFTQRADDILRRSFGQQNKSRPPPPLDQDDENTYSEDEDDELDGLRNSSHPHPLQQIDSKQSFTSVTSTSTTTSNSDIDGRYASLNKQKNKVQVHNQGTSPPPQLKQINPQTQVQNVPAASIDISPKPIAKQVSDQEEETTTASATPIVIKPAKRLSSSQQSDTSSGSTISDDEQKYPATYNEHEPAQTLVKHTPIMKPDDTPRQRFNNVDNRAAQRSEDIHPTPPMMHSAHMGSTSRTAPTSSRTLLKAESVESEGLGSGSDSVSESDGEDRSSAAAYNAQPQATLTARITTPQVTNTTPLTRGEATPTARITTPQLTNTTPLTRGEAPPQRDARTTAAENPGARARTTTENTPRQQVASGTNPNIHFVPPDQRSAINERGGPTATTTQAAPTAEPAQTGSNRFFKSDNAPKSGGRRSIRDAPASIGDRIKSIFRRK